jgi:hypothetical protein
MKVKRDQIRSVLEVQRGGGCVGAIGTAFALWTAMLGIALIMGWRGGDFSMEVFVGGGTALGTFFLCSLGIATYRERFCFDAHRRTLTRIRQVLFVTYRRQQWSNHDFEAAELYWYYRRRNNVTTWLHVIRLLPSLGGGAPPDPLELGSGKAGKEMHDIAHEIADFCNLPLRTPPKDDR